MNHALRATTALALLLTSGTALAADRPAAVNGPPPAQRDENDPPSVVSPEILVTGKPIEHYAAQDSLTAIRVRADQLDLPVSVSVVPHELIEDRSLSFLGEALDNVSGAQRKLGYGGVQNFGAFLRGFDTGFLTLRNGVRDFGFYTLRDTANVERFEVLKGPASILYGAVQPGGITNTVTKKPTTDPLATIEAIAGSFDRYRVEGDFGGPVGGTLGYRLNLSAETAHSFRDEVRNRSYFVAPVVTWRPSASFSWTVEAEHKHSDYTWDLGLPRSPISLTLPIERFLGETDKLNHATSTYLASTIDYRFAPGWRLRQTTGYTFTDGDYALRSAFGYTGRSADRAAYDTTETSHTFVLQNEVVGEFATGPVRHQLVIGLERYQIEQKYNFDFFSLASLDIDHPVYGARPTGGFTLFADRENASSWGVYAQDLISLGDHVKLLVGGRQDWARNSDFDLTSNTLARETRPHHFSPQAGIVIQPDRSTSLYASYGESFQLLTSGRTSTGRYLDPETGRQFEIGAKRMWMGGRLSTSIALYDIHKNNVSTTDPANPLFRVQTGQQRSRGIELDVAGQIVPGWDVIAGGSYIDAAVTRDNRFAIGSRLPGAPEYSAFAWNKVTLRHGALRGLAAGLGIYYADQRQVALPNSFVLPAYTRLDAMLAYPFGRWKAQVNVKNLTDRRIYDLTSTSIFPQEPRSVTVRLAHAF